MNELIAWTTGDSHSESEPLLRGDLARMGPGSRGLMLVGNGRLRLFDGFSQIANRKGGRVMFPFEDSYASLGDYLDGSELISGQGGIAPLIKRIMAVVGAGKIRVAGQDIQKVATTQLTLIVATNAGSYGPGAVSYVAGLVAPSVAPQVAVQAPQGALTGKLQGVYAVAATWVRDPTGGEGNVSPASAVFEADNQILRVNYTETPPAGVTHLGLYCTKRGFPEGPFFLLRHIPLSEFATLDGVANSIRVEWTDLDLLDVQAPRVNYPPASATNLLVLGDRLCLVNAYGETPGGPGTGYGGTSVLVSEPNQPEAYDPDNYIPIPEYALHVTQRQMAGNGLLWCRNSAYELAFVGGRKGVELVGALPEVGIAAPHNVALADNVIYALTSKRGALRIYDQSGSRVVDRNFATPVADRFKDWDLEKAVLGFDPNGQTVNFMHEGDCQSFDVSIGAWNAPPPMIAGHTPQACVANNNELLVAMKGNPIEPDLYVFDAGNAGSPWIYATQWRDLPAARCSIRSLNVVVQQSSDDDITAQIFINGNDDAPAQTVTFTPQAAADENSFAHAVDIRLDLRRVRSVRVKLVQTQAQQFAQVTAITLYGNPRGGR